MRPKCKKCGKPAKNKGVNKKGRQCWSTLCNVCEDKKYRPGRSRYNRLYYKKYFKKDFCEYCGFVPIHSCQLDIHHKDGNRKNNDTTNFMTLCANCHRLPHMHTEQGISLPPIKK